MKRRSFLATAAATTSSLFANHHGNKKQSSKILLSVKYGMCGDGKTPEEKMKRLKDLGYDGVEFHAPSGAQVAVAKAASQATNFPIHGVVNSIHWRTKLSSASADERAKAVEGLKTCLKESHALGGSSVLLVPGVVGGDVTHQQAWDRSIEGIKQALPLAARFGIHILIENVWNNMFYDSKGPNTQSAEQLAKYLDEINSPWVGSYFDIGNHQRFGKPAEWIRTLGKRIVKLDVKDWGVKGGFGKIGDGDVDWPAVRTALKDINYTGWATAEVGGGNKDRMVEVLKNMQTHLLGI